VPPPGIGGVGFGPSPNLDTDHTIYELCLPSERGMEMSMNLADPVSSGEYSGTCVSTAPVAEPTVMSFTVPVQGNVIVATATTVTTCSSSADCSDSAAPMCRDNVCVAMSCGGGSFTPDGAYDSVWDSVRPMTGKYTINYFQYQEDVGCVCMLNDWISSNDEICADNYNYFRFKLKGKGRSEKWEVYLYGDKTIKVERDSAEVLPRGVPPPGIGGVGFGPSPNLDTKHTIYELCLPSERGMGMSMNLADPVSKGSYSGTCVSTDPVAEPNVVSFTVPLSGSTISADSSSSASEVTMGYSRYLTFTFSFDITSSSDSYVSNYGALHKKAMESWLTKLLSAYPSITISAGDPVASRRLLELSELDAHLQVPDVDGPRRLTTTVTSSVVVDAGSSSATDIASVVSSADVSSLKTELCEDGVDCSVVSDIEETSVTSSDEYSTTTSMITTTSTITVTVTEAPEAISGVLVWFLAALGVAVLALLFGAVGSFVVYMCSGSGVDVETSEESARLLLLS